MTDPERTIGIDDFVVVRNPPISPELKARQDQRDVLTGQVLAQQDSPPSGGRLTGSFIYAHPPDYRGRPTLQYSVAQWRELLQELKELGMDTVILQASVWLEFAECYYRSGLFPGFKTWNVLDPLLTAVADEKMKLFLGVVGILFDDDLGVKTGDLSRAKAAAKRELAAYDELRSRYQGAFHGYYLAPETSFQPQPNPHHQACWNAYMERVTNEVKSRTPELPVLVSPYTPPAPGREEEAIDSLLRLYRDCRIDIFSPQDSIGCGNNLSFLEAGLTIWKTVAARQKAAFWVNCESFSVTNYNGPIITIVPAEFRRLAVQLSAAARLGAEKLVTWEACHFMSRHGEPAARQLRRDYLAYAT